MHPGLADRVDRPLLLKDGCRKAEQGQRRHPGRPCRWARGTILAVRTGARSPKESLAPCPNTRLRCPRREWRRTVLQRCSRQKRSGRDPRPAPRPGGLGGPRAAGRFERLGQGVVRAAAGRAHGTGSRPPTAGAREGPAAIPGFLRGVHHRAGEPARQLSGQRPVTIARQQNSPPARGRHIMSLAAVHPARGEVAAGQAHHLAVAGPGLLARCCLRRRRPASPITRLRRRPACRSRAPRPRGVQRWSREHRRYRPQPCGPRISAQRAGPELGEAGRLTSNSVAPGQVTGLD